MRVLSFSECDRHVGRLRYVYIDTYSLSSFPERAEALCVPDVADSITQLLYFHALWFSVSHITRLTREDEALGQMPAGGPEDQSEAELLCVAAGSLCCWSLGILLSSGKQTMCRT